MNVISPDTHEVRIRIIPKGLNSLERKMFRCMAVIYAHGGHGDRGKFAKFHHKKFQINHNDGITRAQTIFEGVAGRYKSFIQVQPGYRQGSASTST